MSISLLIVLAFVVAFLASFASTPWARELAHLIGAIDDPKDARKIHKVPTPRLGGIAIFFGFLLAVVCFVILTPEIISIIIGSMIIVVMGAFDDRKPMRAITKLLIQIVAALIVALSGVRIEILTNPLLFVNSDYLFLGNLSIPITVIWIVAITNAVNLIDGLDGLAAGVASISSVCILIISLMVSESNIAILIACLTGACIGFLPYNFNPASIFMGDSGSNFLGFILACVSIEGLFKGYAVISFAVPLLLLALPIFDTSVAILRRIKDKKPVMAPDRGHLHHKLVDMGFSTKQAVLILYTITAVLGLSAIILTGFGALRAIMLLAGALFAMLISIYFFKERNNKND